MMMNESGFPPSSSSNYSSTFHLDHYDTATFLTDVLEMESEAINHELGFIDLLNMHHFPPTSSILHQPLSSTSNQDQFFNAPPTPNSSSISSQDPQPQPQDDGDDDDDDQLQNTTSSNKQLVKSSLLLASSFSHTLLQHLYIDMVKTVEDVICLCVNM